MFCGLPIFRVVSETFQTEHFHKKADFGRLGSGPSRRLGSGQILGQKQGHLGPELNRPFVNFLGQKEQQEPSTLCLVKMREKKQYGQNLAVQMGKIGSEPNLTAYIFVCIYIYIYIYMPTAAYLFFFFLSLSLSLLSTSCLIEVCSSLDDSLFLHLSISLPLSPIP